MVTKAATKAANTKETFEYHSSDELASLSEEELQIAWDMVPNDAREYVEKRYAAVVRKNGVVQDGDELRLAEGLIERYKLEGYVPSGEYWAKVKPKTIRDIVERLNEDPIQVEQKVDAEKKSSPPFLMFGAIGLVAVFLIFILSRLVFGSSSNEVEGITGTPTETLTPTPTTTSTPLPTNTPLPTLTPFAFTNVDRFVGEGDRTNADFFPVALTIGDGNTAPRVFIVQEREVETAEWVYETNADVATWLSASSIRPVFAIPYSESNETFLASLSEGISFEVRMNTGAELVFDYIGTNQVGRNDTSYFLQDSPGIVLALVGKTDETGLPSSDVFVVLGSYRMSSELDQLAMLQSSLGAVGDTLYAGPAAISVTGYDIEAEFLGEGTISDYVLVLVEVAIEARTGLVALDQLQFSIVDQTGLQSVPAWSEEYPLPLDDIPQGEIRYLQIPYLLSRQMGDSEMRVRYQDQQVAYLIGLTPPPVSLVTGLDVQIRSVEHDTRNIFISARVFNNQAGAVYLAPSDVTVILGYVSQPIGVERSPEMWSGITIQPGEAWDIDFQFAWNGRDPYGMFMIAGRSYAMQIIEPN